MMSRINGLEGMGERIASSSDRMNDVEQSNARLRDQMAESDRKRLEEMNEVNARLAALEKQPTGLGHPHACAHVHAHAHTLKHMLTQEASKETSK